MEGFILEKRGPWLPKIFPLPPKETYGVFRLRKRRVPKLEVLQPGFRLRKRFSKSANEKISDSTFRLKKRNTGWFRLKKSDSNTNDQVYYNLTLKGPL